MSLLVRWWRFNLVGAMGMALQLSALALLNRWNARHYLCASALSVELALLHNFIWHHHYTWRDRRDSSTPLASLLRFHLSNGLISLGGNVMLMHILVAKAGIPLLCSNLIAIACCSVLNFAAGDRWAFTASPRLPIRFDLNERRGAWK